MRERRRGGERKRPGMAHSFRTRRASDRSLAIVLYQGKRVGKGLMMTAPLLAICYSLTLESIVEIVSTKSAYFFAGLAKHVFLPTSLVNTFKCLFIEEAHVVQVLRCSMLSGRAPLFGSMRKR